MNAYYTAIISIVILAAFVMIMLIAGNRVLDKVLKRSLILEFIILIGIVSTEWLNIRLNGTEGHVFRALHYLVKCIEFSLTPAIPSVILLSVSAFEYKQIIKFLLGINVVLQLVSVHTGWIFYMTEENIYVRGHYYVVFVAIYSIAVLLLVYTIFKIGKKYQVKNIHTLFLGLLFAIFGVGLQLFMPDVKTSWLTVEIGLLLAYIYFNDMLYQSDRLTTLLNRWCFERTLDECNYDSAILIFDIDDFKSINDTYGHSAGDECLVKVSSEIRNVFGKEGSCYRIGGDEFSVILDRKSPIAKDADEKKLVEKIKAFYQIIEKLSKEDSRLNSVAVGYCFVKKDECMRAAYENADRYMYIKKDSEKRK